MNPENSQQKFLNYLIILVLGLASAIYYQIVSFEFLLNFDDDILILNNPTLRDFSWAGIQSLFSSFYDGLYHPITSLVWMIEMHFFGNDPQNYHIVNLVLHLVNTFLVFQLGKKLGKRIEIGLIAALLFALQPLHVENVAWVSSQKDLLVGLFFLLSLLSYSSYREKANPIKLIITLLWVLLAMMSKASAVSLPILFVLIDWLEGERDLKKMFASKWSFFLLAILFSVLNYLAQKEYGYISAMGEEFGIIHQLSFVFYSAFYYLQKLLVPLDLSPKNLYPEEVNSIPIIYYLSVLILGIIGFIGYQLRRKEAWLVFGLLFYLVAIAPNLNFILTGNDIVSNRYAYLAFIGLYIMIAYYMARMKKIAMIAVILIIAAFWSKESFSYSPTFQNSYNVWTAVIKAHEDRKWGLAMAYNERGQVLYKEGKYKIALEDVNRALQIEPEMSRALLNRANLLDRGGKLEEALRDLDFLLSLEENNVDAIKIRSTIYGKLNRIDEAIADVERALILDPENPELFNNLGILYSIREEYPRAIENFKKAIELAPLYLQAHMNLGKLYIDLDQNENAMRELAIVYEQDPDVYYNAYLLGKIYFKLGEDEKAEIILRKFAVDETQASQIANSLVMDSLYAQSIPYYTIAMGNRDIRSKSLYQRAQAYIKIGEKQNALDDLLALIEVVPNPQFFFDIAELYREMENQTEACHFYNEAKIRDHPEGIKMLEGYCKGVEIREH